MLRKVVLASAAAAILAAPLSVSPSAHAGIFVGVRVVAPAYYRPGPVVVYDPPPVVVAPPPPVVVTQPPPVVVPAPPPVVTPAPAPVIVTPAPAPPVVVVARWHVQYRVHLGEPWHEYGAYRHRWRAVDAKDFLVRRGYRVRIVHY
jgi:hypothetical protein